MIIAINALVKMEEKLFEFKFVFFIIFYVIVIFYFLNISYLIFIINILFKSSFILGIGDWGLGIGDWGFVNWAVVEFNI